MDKELEQYIDLALADGVVTEKEKSVLIKKAEEKGVDQDELEMVLDAKLHLMNKENAKADKAQEIPDDDLTSCPNCGAQLKKSTIKCQFCDFELTRKKATGERFIEDLQNKLIEAETSGNKSLLNKVGFTAIMGDTDLAKRQATVISTFTMPNDKENLIEFLQFCNSNVDTFKPAALRKQQTYSTDKVLHPAWKSKAKLAYDKLKRFAKDDSDVSDLLSNYSEQYEGGKKKKWF